MPLSNGATFAGFRIVRLLGSGGMGEVYLAQHPRLPKQIALKILPTATALDTEYRERFAREADLAATLYHPHIVGVHDRGESVGQLWIAMDFVDGADAGRLLTERYPAGMPLAQVVAIVSAVAGALDYAHRRGMLHRDVKPANIMMTDDEEAEQRILLADFGIARNLDDISGLTATNMAVGTVAYSAPEQLMGETVDGRTDQYALAATAYHLLTGSQLFPHSNPAVVISRHLNVLPPALADARPGLAALDPALATALAKDPSDRFVKCVDFARALAEGVTSSGTSAPNLATQPALSARKSKEASSRPDSPALRATDASAHVIHRRWVATAVLIGVLALVGACAFVVWRPWKQHSTASTTATLVTPPTISTAQMTPTAAAAPPPPPTPTTTQLPQGNGYALTGCYDSQSRPADRPTFVNLLHCASGGFSLENMSWTSWGPYGADGTGNADIRVCQPDCADGRDAIVPVLVHAWSPLPSAVDSGCPRNVEFYADMVLAFPKDEPPLEANTPALSRYNGMPAIQYTSTSDPGPPIQTMNPPFCSSY